MNGARLIVDAVRGGRTVPYGTDPSQRADLRLPSGAGPHPVAVLVHGGSWRARYGRIVMRGLAGDLVRRGFATWNIEYRRLGNGGGWPATFQDVASAIDALAAVPAALDLARVTLIGHSAGGHLALWAAGRERLPSGAPGAGEPAVRPQMVVAQAGVCDLEGAYRLWRGGVVRELMGGGPDEVPERFAAGDPIRLMPPVMPVLLVHGSADRVVSIDLARSYERVARAAGGEVSLVEIAGAAGGHRNHIDPRGQAWAAVIDGIGPAS